MKRDGQKIAADFMESAIKVIARDGFDKASTRNIAKECGLADAYIYHYYKDKDDLFFQAFQKEDTALAAKVKQHLLVMQPAGLLYGRPLSAAVWLRLEAPGGLSGQLRVLYAVLLLPLLSEIFGCGAFQNLAAAAMTSCALPSAKRKM